MISFTMRLRERREEGFSLVELMVAIAIMGILAAIAIPAYLNQRKTAVDATIVSDIKSTSTQIETALSSYPEARCINSTQSAKNLTIRLYAAVATTCTGTALTSPISFLSDSGNILVVTGDPYGATGYIIIGKNTRGTAPTVGYTYKSNLGGFQ